MDYKEAFDEITVDSRIAFNLCKYKGKASGEEKRIVDDWHLRKV